MLIIIIMLINLINCDINYIILLIFSNYIINYYLLWNGLTITFLWIATKTHHSVTSFILISPINISNIPSNITRSNLFNKQLVGFLHPPQSRYDNNWINCIYFFLMRILMIISMIILIIILIIICSRINRISPNAKSRLFQIKVVFHVPNFLTIYG